MCSETAITEIVIYNILKALSEFTSKVENLFLWLYGGSSTRQRSTRFGIQPKDLYRTTLTEEDKTKAIQYCPKGSNVCINPPSN
ncbi:hypothetical protein AYI69_g2891 [Smittium culicis]|uniref:Uncharacterized protein n=1 Tax=Smittium culicis TaxID=133412 RepID=A0A1R1YL55_9FUNG|nr:hypothetical protein AYI69_g2891 [Smittium culicis]